MTRMTAALLLLLALLPGQASAEDHVCFETNVGDICMRLMPDAAPETVANFLRYVDRGAYNGTLIHRSVRVDFSGIGVIQGGGFSGLQTNFTQQVATDPPIRLEFRRSNLRATVAMARIGGNPDSATSQWFINVTDNLNLDLSSDGGYAVFAEITHGMDVVTRINNLYPVNLSGQLGNAFTTMPTTLPFGSQNVDLDDFVIVSRARRLVLQPWQCSESSPGDTLTEFCGSFVRMPISSDGQLYDGSLELVASTSGIVFQAVLSRLRPLADTGQQRATFNGSELLIPSVRVGASVYENVRLVLTKAAPIEFTVASFTVR